VLSCMHEPQNIPAPPAVMIAIFMWESSLRGYLLKLDVDSRPHISQELLRRYVPLHDHLF